MIKEMWVLASALHAMQIPTITGKMGIMPPRIVADRFLQIHSAGCILEIQESHQQFSNFNNSLVLLGPTPAGTTEPKLHGSSWTFGLLVWETAMWILLLTLSKAVVF